MPASKSLRLTRRELLKLAGGAAFVAAAPACAQAPQPQAPTTGESKPRRGGIFRLPVNAAITPWPPIGLIQNLMVNKVLFNQLVKPGKDLTPQPDLAERWEVSADGLTWTFYLRKDVTWHDGQPFTADDVIYSLQVYKDPQSRSIFRSSLEPIVRMDAPDRYTVRLATGEPFSSLLEILSYLIFIMPRHRLEGQNLAEPTEFISRPIGTGAFKFEEHVRGDHLTLVRNDNYFLGQPYLDAIIYKVIPDVNNAVAQVRTGELDIAFIAMDHYDALKDLPNIRIDEAYQIDVRFMGLNEAHPRVGPWFSDKRVRQAFSYAIDRNGILKQVTRDKGLAATNIIPPFFKAWYNPNLKPYPYDPERAGRLLREAGWQPGPDGVLQKGGEKLRFEALCDKGNTEREQTALIVQQNLKAIGVQAEVNFMEFNAMLNRVRGPRDHEATIYYYVTPNSPDVFSYFGCGGATNEYGYCNQELDRLFREARRVFDYDKRREIYYKIQEILADDLPWVFIYHPVELRAMNRKVRNFPAIGYRDALLYMHEVWLEQ
jgi:peptide/nickel transport system substrate-binding protein